VFKKKTFNYKIFEIPFHVSKFKQRPLTKILWDKFGIFEK